TAHALGLPEYLADRIHLTALPGNEIRAAGGDLLTMTRAERAALPFMHPGRVDVIGGGALVWAAIVERVQAVAGDVPVVTSEHDILDGIALSAAGGSH
ncbi:MAG: exopolyphosphatase, partial [Austwickia sp.]|nr:exopolyphosphatase [Austwickia sp.]